MPVRKEEDVPVVQTLAWVYESGAGAGARPGERRHASRILETAGRAAKELVEDKQRLRPTCRRQGNKEQHVRDRNSVAASNSPRKGKNERRVEQRTGGASVEIGKGPQQKHRERSEAQE